MGSLEGHLKQNFEISPLGHFPDPQSGKKTINPETTQKLPGTLLTLVILGLKWVAVGRCSLLKCGHES